MEELFVALKGWHSDPLLHIFSIFHAIFSGRIYQDEVNVHSFVYLCFLSFLLSFVGGQAGCGAGSPLTVYFYSPAACMICRWLCSPSLTNTLVLPYKYHLLWSKLKIQQHHHKPQEISFIHSFIPKIWTQSLICIRLFANAVDLALSKLHYGSCPREAYNLKWLTDIINWIIILKIIIWILKGRI